MTSEPLLLLQRGRPVPHLREPDKTPSDYLENGNPDLNSDTNTLDSRSVEDGVCPILDTASEASELLDGSKQRSLSYQHKETKKDQEQDNSDKENTVPKPRKHDDSLRRTLFMGSNSTIDSEADLGRQITRQTLPFQTYHQEGGHIVHGTVPMATMKNGGNERDVLDFRECEPVDGDDEEDDRYDDVDEEYEDSSEDEFKDTVDEVEEEYAQDVKSVS